MIFDSYFRLEFNRCIQCDKTFWPRPAVAGCDRIKTTIFYYSSFQRHYHDVQWSFYFGMGTAPATLLYWSLNTMRNWFLLFVFDSSLRMSIVASFNDLVDKSTATFFGAFVTACFTLNTSIWNKTLYIKAHIRLLVQYSECFQQSFLSAGVQPVLDSLRVKVVSFCCSRESYFVPFHDCALSCRTVNRFRRLLSRLFIDPSHHYGIVYYSQEILTFLNRAMDLPLFLLPPEPYSVNLLVQQYSTLIYQKRRLSSLLFILMHSVIVPTLRLRLHGAFPASTQFQNRILLTWAFIFLCFS